MSIRLIKKKAKKKENITKLKYVQVKEVNV